jgi:N-acetylmuramoyl-L-alanine amidase
LLNFDFTGICDRSTDSNGYSLRIAGQDLGLQYGLRLVQRNNDLVLMAYSLGDRTLPDIELGRTNGITDGFGKIILDPGWRLTRRVYRHRNLPHLYLTRDNIPSGISLAAMPSSVTPSALTRSVPIATRPQTPLNPQRLVIPPRPRTGASVLTAPIEIPVPPPAPAQQPEQTTIGSLPAPPSASGVLPVPTSQIPLGNAGNGLPTITISQIPGSRSNIPGQPSNLAAALGYNYRLLVPLDKPNVEAKVRGLVPSAFRTRLNGQLMMQVGLFQEQYEAEAMRQTLAAQNIQATIVPVN